MRCSEAQQLVKPYIQKKLSDREMEDFLDHIEHCPDCYEELEIYFSIYETLGAASQDSEDERYDFEEKLRLDLESARRHLHRRKASRLLRTVFFAFAVILFVLVALTGIELGRTGGVEGTTLYHLIYGHQPETETEETSQTEKEEEETVQARDGSLLAEIND